MAPPRAGTSHAWCRGEGRALEQGFPALLLEGQGGTTPAFSQGRLQGCEARCTPRGAQGCPSEQVSCALGGCVLGQGLSHLPGSALSL